MCNSYEDGLGDAFDIIDKSVKLLRAEVSLLFPAQRSNSLTVWAARAQQQLRHSTQKKDSRWIQTLGCLKRSLADLSSTMLLLRVLAHPRGWTTVRQISSLGSRRVPLAFKPAVIPCRALATSGDSGIPPQEFEPVDPADPDGSLSVYRGVLSAQIRLVKAFSITTSVIGLSFQVSCSI